MPKSATKQLSLFAPPRQLPEGFAYRAGFVSPDEERRLLAWLAGLPFREFEFGPYRGKRRVVSYGWKYDFTERELQKSEDLPEALLPLRDKAAVLAGLAADDLQHALVTEYPPGAAIGWHKDKRVFGDVIGISLASPCTFRFRRKSGSGWERASMVAEPRSAYLLRGPARDQWEHSIPAVGALRYSVTFRSFAGNNRADGS